MISILNLKGGTGKSTTAMYLATCAHLDDHRVVVLDADNEKTALGWASTGAIPFEVQQADTDGLVVQAKKLHGDGYTVIIDGPPNARDILWAAATVSDIVVVPVAPTTVDINRLRSTLKVLLNIEQTRPEGLNTRILFTRYQRRTRLARQAVDALDKFPVLKATIRDLERYKHEFGTLPSYTLEYDQVWRELTDA